MGNSTSNRSIRDMTAEQLKELVKEAIREEHQQAYFIDEEGYIVFRSEKAYTEYLDKQPDKLPSEVRAFFIDEQGYKASYSDFVPIAKKASELKKAKKEPTIEAEQVWQQLRKLGVKV